MIEIEDIELCLDCAAAVAKPEEHPRNTLAMRLRFPDGSVIAIFTRDLTTIVTYRPCRGCDFDGDSVRLAATLAYETEDEEDGRY